MITKTRCVPVWNFHLYVSQIPLSHFFKLSTFIKLKWIVHQRMRNVSIDLYFYIRGIANLSLFTTLLAVYLRVYLSRISHISLAKGITLKGWHIHGKHNKFVCNINLQTSNIVCNIFLMKLSCINLHKKQTKLTVTA